MTIDATSVPHGAMSSSTTMTDVAPTPKHFKLGGYDFYRSIGSPRYVVAPMVDQSELAWRMMSRSPLPENMAGPSSTVTGSTGKVYTRHQGGAHLCYTPMINAKSFAQSKAGLKGMDPYYNTAIGEEGHLGEVAGIDGGDAPVFVQFCANDPEVLLQAAKRVEKHCDAVDINFGCPQGIAKRGHYGSFLQDEWELIRSLIGILHENLSVPVTAKFRIHPSVERTIAYARMMEAAGAQMLTCHGRTREMKGQVTGLADWEIIRQVKAAVNIPVFANGNILYYEDVERCLEVTGCDGVMTAEGNLYNPSLFLPPSHPHMHPPATVLAKRYLDIVSSLKTPTASSAIKSHLFRMLKPILDAQPDERMRERIGKARNVEGYRVVVGELEDLVKSEMDAAGPSWRAPPINTSTGYRTLPKWAAQPYIRAETITINAAAAPTRNDPMPHLNGSSGGISGPLNPTTSIVSAIIEPDTLTSANGTAAASTPTHTAVPVEAPLIAQPGPASSSSAAAALTCFHPSCSHIAATRCPHRACLTHCRSTQAVAASVAAARLTDSSDGVQILSEEEAESQARSGKLEGQGCEAHEEKVRARAEREKERRAEKAARVAAGKQKKRELWETKRRKDEAKAAGGAAQRNGIDGGDGVAANGARGKKRHASVEADEAEKPVPVLGTVDQMGTGAAGGSEVNEEAALNAM